MRKMRLVTIFVIYLMVMLPFAFAQSPGELPINADVPEYASSERIDITGTTDPGTRVDLYVNGILQRKFDPESTGVFEFNQVGLSAFKKPNVILLEATKDGVKNSASYNVFVDTEKPVITIDRIPGVVTESTVNVKGSVSEVAVINISLNGKELQSFEAESFDKPVTLDEGANDLVITATDRAGNVGIKEGKILVDTEPPIIAKINPKPGAFFYETDPITDIQGETEPFAKVYLYINKRPDGDPDEEETASASGQFEFDDVNIEKGYALAGRGGYTGVRGDEDLEGREIPVDTQDIYEEADMPDFRKQNAKIVKLYIVAEDSAGQRTEESITYTVGTCFAGEMAWNVANLVEYQSPNTLSPERLSEGTEIITFILNMSYQGLGTKAKIKNVKFEKACQAAEVQGERYQYGCKVLTSPMVKGNDARTTWYVRYNLRRLEGMDNFTEDVWEDLTKQFIFPLKVRITYTHEIDGKPETDYQTQCLNLGYHVDTSRIDPREVLPDWLRGDGMEFINESISKLNDIIPKVETVMKYTAIACIVGFGLKVITTIYRRWQGWMDYFTDRADASLSDEQKCPKPGTRFDSKRTGTAITQAELSNEELLGRCETAHAAWETEKSAYKAYRWACDRFLCHSTPARWTEQAIPVEGRKVGTEEDEAVWEKIREGLTCTEQTSTRGIVLRENKECTTRINKQCFDYNGKTYSYSGETVTRRDTVYYELNPVDPKTGVDKIGSKLEVIKQGNSVMIEEPEGKLCQKLCKEKKFKKGDCIDPQAFTSAMAGDDAKNKIFNTKDCIETRKVCYCSTDRTDEQKLTIPGDYKGEWDYRYDKINRVSYSKYIYYDERDASACFGQNNWIFSSSPYLDVRDTIPAFQCVCVSQIRARLVLLRNILMGMYNCLKQIDKSGKADAGVCKEIFTQYICKWISRMISYFAQGCVPWKGLGSEADIGDFVQAGTDSIFGGVEEATSDLLSDYDNVALRDYLGIGEGAVTEKVCLFAFTGDWGFDFEGLMNAAYATPFRTSATAWPAEREYLTWNPDNQQATYEYKAAWMIAPGCQIDSYTINLACVTDYELDNYDGVACYRDKVGAGDDALSNGCDCSGTAAGSRMDQTRPGPSVRMDSGRNLGQGVFEDDSKHVVQEAPYRYDHVKIQLNVNDPKLAEQCFPRENMIGARSAVFYSPINDITTKDVLACRFDQTTGSFVCDQGRLLWDLRGKAYFGEIKYDNQTFLDEAVKINEMPIYVQSKKQCLHVTLRNGYGQVLAESYKTLDHNQEEPERTRLIDDETRDFSVLDPVKLEHFGKYADRVTVSSEGMSNDPSINYRRVIKDDGPNIVSGSYNVYFKDEENDQYDYGTHIKIGNNGVWQQLMPETYWIPENGMAFTFTRPRVKSDSKCAGESVPCKKFIFRITKGRARETDKAQKWTLNLELRHAPGESNEGQCEDSTERDAIFIAGKKASETITLTAHPYTRDKARVCTYRDGTRANKEECSCDGDSDVEEDVDCTGDKNKNGIADEDESWYCYRKTENEGYMCRTYRKCYTGSTPNTINCDCNMNNVITDDNCGGENKYCWAGEPYAGQCRPTYETIIEKPEIIKMWYSYRHKTGTRNTSEIPNVQGIRIPINLADVKENTGITFRVQTRNANKVEISTYTGELDVSRSTDTWTTSEFEPETQDYNFLVIARATETGEPVSRSFILSGK